MKTRLLMGLDELISFWTNKHETTSLCMHSCVRSRNVLCHHIKLNVEVDPASLLVLPLQIVFSMMRSVFVLQFWAACYKLTQSVFKMGFVLAKSVG